MNMDKVRLFKFRLKAKVNGHVIDDLLLQFHADTLENATKLLHGFCEMEDVEIIELIRTIII